MCLLFGWDIILNMSKTTTHKKETEMKPKTARRFLNRNGWKIAVRKLNGVKRAGFVKTCLKVLRNDIRDTKNKASIAAHNKVIYK